MKDDYVLVKCTDEDNQWIYNTWRLYRNIKFSDKTDDCWIWRSIDSNGYGRIWYNNRSYLAHRLSYELHHRFTLTPKQVIRHRCHTPLCVNPHHLCIGTQKQNVDDMLQAGREGFTRKITEQQKKQIKRSILTLQQLADTYGVSKTTIWRIKNVDKSPK
tara:strand:- start:12 stop:488 length:477 start_codon:yes stop_codon:yes gene_type:complete